MVRTRGERLRTARARRGFRSARVAAIALGVPIATYGAHERAEAPGGRDYGPDQAKFYARRFGVSPEWLLTGRGQGERDEFAGAELRQDEQPAPTIPVVGYVGAGGEVHLYAVARGDLDQVHKPKGLNDTAVALEIRSDILGAHFNRWFILYDSVRRPPKPELLRDLCVIGLPDGRVLLRQLQRGAGEDLYNLLSPTEAMISDAKVDWASRVDKLSRGGKGEPAA